MNEHKAVCPRCKNEVQFAKTETLARCPACGFEYPLTPPLASRSAAAGASSILLKIFGGVLIGFGIIAGIFALVLAIAFVGCLVSVGRM